MPRENWVEIGRLDDIPLRGARRVARLDGAPPVAVFRTGDDEIFALIDRCPHRGGPLSEGIVQGNAVACPLHGWVIELGTGQAEAPDEGCTGTVAVRRDGDRILLLLPSCETEDAPRWEAA
jgi:nitrite reductase [NAD(P)H] small subunit